MVYDPSKPVKVNDNLVYDPSKPVKVNDNLVYDTTQPAPATTLAQNTTQPLQPTNVNDMNVSEDAASLYVDPTPMFQPAIDFIGQQRSQANERYAQNKADIANIFGNLTQVNKESQERVNQQFQASIADQQMKTAQRLAQAQQGAEATQASALRAIDERGGGPMGNIMASPAMEQAQRGIGDVNRFAQIWQGQQGAIQQQTQQDLQAGLRSLGQQEVQSNMQLKQSLEGTLNQLAGQEVGVRTSLAEAIYGGKSNVAQANYNEILAQKAADEAARLAAIRGAYDVQQAEIDAANKLAVAQANASNRVNNYQENSAGVTQFMRNEGASDNDINTFWANLDSTDYATATNSAQAFQNWLDANSSVQYVGGSADNPQTRDIGPSYAEQAAARLYFDGLRYDKPDPNAVPTSAIDLSQAPSGATAGGAGGATTSGTRPPNFPDGYRYSFGTVPVQ